uniref:Uncharacterized protein n=1 Tax=Arundo donax TaxID=35708 RepID=A0A0A9DW37_ARUDO
MENPSNALTEEQNPHMLCMSEARDGCVMLFCATRASTVTSAMAAPELCAVSASNAGMIPTSRCRDSVSIDETPITPTLSRETKKQNALGFTYTIES